MITSLLLSALLSAGGDAPLPASPRLEILLNGSWQYAPGDVGWFSDTSLRVRVPGAFQHDDMVQEVCAWYRRTWNLPDALRDDGARWLLRFDKAGWYTRVDVNGTMVGENYGSYVPFEFEVTKALRFGEENELKVFVHAADSTHTLPGETIDDLHRVMGFRTGGRHNRNWVQIAGDVTLEKRPAHGIAYHRVETSVRNKTLRIVGELSCPPGTDPLQASVHDLETGKKVLDTELEVGETFEVTLPWADPILWGFGPYGTPHLYALRLVLQDQDGGTVDTVVSRFGFRELWYEGQTLLFNGKPFMMTAATIPYDFTPLPPYLYPYGMFEPHQFTRWCQALRAHGWNAVHNHFDSFGTGIYDVADELGMPVVAGLYCAGASWLTPNSKVDPRWPAFMHDQTKAWTKAIAGHSSVVLYSLIDGVPGPSPEWPLDKIHAQLDEAGAIRAIDETRPIVGGDVDFVKQGIAKIREEAARSFQDNGHPRFIKEVWAVDAGSGYATKAMPGFLAFMEKEKISGFVSFGKSFPTFPFHVTWPSDTGRGMRWQARFAPAGFTGWLNWCDPDQPLHQPSDVGDLLKEQYVARWGSPGETEPWVYPDILSESHGADTALVGIESLVLPGAPLRFTPVDSAGNAMLHVSYPGAVRLHALGSGPHRTMTLDAPRRRLPYAPGYQEVLTANWPATVPSPVAIRLEGTENAQHFPLLKIHLQRNGQDAGYVNVRFPEAIQATDTARRQVLKFYQDVWSPEWPAHLACEPVDLPVRWDTTDGRVAYTMQLDNGMVLHASATVTGAVVTLRYDLENHTPLTLEEVGIWNCIQMQLAPPLDDPLMDRTYCWTDRGFQLMRSLVPGFRPYTRDQAVNRRFSAYLPGIPKPYPENPYIVPHPGHPDDPDQRIWFWTVTNPIPRAAIATVSKDGTWAALTQGKGARGVWTNPGISCHHADPVGKPLPPKGRLTISNTLRFVEGSLPARLD